MSTFRYGTVYFHYAKTRFDQRPRYDSLAGVDVIMIDRDIFIHGVVSSSPSQLPTNSPLTYSQVYHLLTKPRQPLVYVVNGEDVILWNPINTGPDADFGPKPIKVDVKEVHEGTFFVDAHYRVSTVDCGEQAGTIPVTSLRWSQSESVDENWLRRITTRGKLVVRADLKKTADSFRDLCTPPVLNDFRRVQADYVLSPSGAELDFTFVDQEVDRMPPDGCTTYSGKYLVQVSAPGIKRVGTVNLTLHGPKGSSRRELIIRAYAIALAKLKNDAALVWAPLWWGTFEEDLAEPRVTVVVSAHMSQLTGKGILRDESPEFMPSVGRTGFDPSVKGQGYPGLAPPIRGRVLALVCAAFRDPCTSSPVTTTAEMKSERGGSSPNPAMGASLKVADTDPDFGGGGDFGSEEDRAPYDEYEITSTVSFDPGVRGIPGTGTGPSAKKAIAVTVHGGIMYLDVSWVASRMGRPPILPSFKPADPNWVALPSSVATQAIGTSADGVLKKHTVAGTFRYFALDPDKVSITAPVPPFMKQLAARSPEDSAKFVSDNILWQFMGADGPNVLTDRVQHTETTPAEPGQTIPTSGTSQGTPGGLGKQDGQASLLPQLPVNP